MHRPIKEGILSHFLFFLATIPLLIQEHDRPTVVTSPVSPNCMTIVQVKALLTSSLLCLKICFMCHLLTVLALRKPLWLWNTRIQALSSSHTHELLRLSGETPTPLLYPLIPR